MAYATKSCQSSPPDTHNKRHTPASRLFCPRNDQARPSRPPPQPPSTTPLPPSSPLISPLAQDLVCGSLHGPWKISTSDQWYVPATVSGKSANAGLQQTQQNQYTNDIALPPPQRPSQTASTSIHPSRPPSPLPPAPCPLHPFHLLPPRLNNPRPHLILPIINPKGPPPPPIPPHPIQHRRHRSPQNPPRRLVVIVVPSPQHESSGAGFPVEGSASQGAVPAQVQLQVYRVHRQR